MSKGCDRFLAVMKQAVEDGSLLKLTLGRHRGSDASLRNLFVRPVSLRAGPRLGFVLRHQTRDLTKNYPPAEGLAELEKLIGREFLSAHLFTRTETLQLEIDPDGRDRLRTIKTPLRAGHRPDQGERRPTGDGNQTPDPDFHAHDRPKSHLIPPQSSWLRALGVTNEQGRPRQGMASKFRQIERFAELLDQLVSEAWPGRAGPQGPPESIGGPSGPAPPAEPLSVYDMGSGKGYLTFAVSSLLGAGARVRGIEARPDLVELCNRVAREEGLAPQLEFGAGTIAGTPVEKLDLLIALHACDTATDDALAKGISAGARLMIVAPCCQKELRPQLAAPPVLQDAFRHGIFQERQAEFATDALRAQLLEWAGYRTTVFEFISTEHTAKNTMIAAIKAGPGRDEPTATRIRSFAAFYGIRHQALAAHLGFNLA